MSIYTSANSFKLNYKSYIKRLNHFSHLASLVQILPMPCFIALPLCLSTWAEPSNTLLINACIWLLFLVLSNAFIQTLTKYHTSLCSIVSDQKQCYENSWILIILKIILLPMTKFKIWFLALAVLGNAGVHLYFESISTISLTMQLYLYHKIIVEHA